MNFLCDITCCKGFIWKRWNLFWCGNWILTLRYPEHNWEKIKWLPFTRTNHTCSKGPTLLNAILSHNFTSTIEWNCIVNTGYIAYIVMDGNLMEYRQLRTHSIKWRPDFKVLSVWMTEGKKFKITAVCWRVKHWPDLAQCHVILHVKSRSVRKLQLDCN